MRLALTLGLLLACAARAGASVTLQWTVSSGTNIAGYFVYVGSTSPGMDSRANRFNAGTNRFWSVFVPPGTWYAQVTAYSTNNTDHVAVESAPSNEVMFYVPRAPTNEVRVDGDYAPSLITLATNPTATITLWLQVSTNLATANWSEGVPAIQYNVGNGSNAFYRTRMTVQPAP